MSRVLGLPGPEPGLAAVGLVLDVVDFARAGGLVTAAGLPAVLVPEDPSAGVTTVTRSLQNRHQDQPVTNTYTPGP